MGREKRTTIQLRAMVQVRLNALPEVMEMKARLPHAGPIAGAVVPLVDDPQGRTWDMRDLFQGAGYGETFRAIVDELCGRYDLAE